MFNLFKHTGPRRWYFLVYDRINDEELIVFHDAKLQRSAAVGVCERLNLVRHQFRGPCSFWGRKIKWRDETLHIDEANIIDHYAKKWGIGDE